ncbi:MAG: GNAT family N-acetyltransferase [Armatimonadota bacterium]
MPQSASCELLTERLRITPFRESDTPLFHAYRNEPETARYQSWSVPYSHKAAADFILWAADATLAEFSGSCQFAIHIRETDALIGDIAVLGDLSNGRQVMLGYTLAQRFQGNGYAYEACTAMLDHAFGKWEMHRIAADTDPRNLASKRLLERLGFRLEGHMIECYQDTDGSWLDSHIYALLAREWLK